MFVHCFKSRRVSAGLVLALALALGTGPLAFAAPPSAAPAATTALPWQQVKLLADVMQLVKQDYVEPVSDATLLTNSIRGMLAGLDPHSAYLDKSDYQQLQIITTDQFGGLGLEVTQQDGAVMVVSPIDGTPAAKAGIQSGDLILRVNGTALDGLTLDQAVALMRGKPGTVVTLTALRRGVAQPLSFTLTRTQVHLTSVHSRLLQPGYGYLRISQFSEDTADGVMSAVKSLVQQNHAPLKGLILDLRNNPGGLLDAAVDVADDFLDSGVIVSARGRAPDSNFMRRATPGDILAGAPMVVLVNAGTASAAEITAGALQDNHRALILGTQTFGKGSVQTVIPLPEGGALKLTTSLYYTPSGHSIQAEGIKPNIVVPEFKLTAPTAAETLTEANLQGHLANNAPAPQPAANLSAKDQLAQQDFQLYEALNVLKGLTLAGRD
ncbi:MAG: S41 family peptidase [Gammaproteobacteria bacterium]|nr:S41 family peptidase [Gammaproteobacteria bacterium]MBU6509468.1 S41 family peptidase [Gammaproteobacteria bacterium]MDE1983464.1 S41 family peptidase [Gammaproteobacteria bacterium]MDE2108751.1 S41 family peptidase [Gammaproteobacteria bacterium]MDE2461442.1 S41 family peptidase [Gammaproteobacteria bacterium]